MGSNMKLAAERLLKIAEDLEKEAACNTFFVCDGCNHTASLQDINVKRKTAGENHNVKRIANVSVNDSVTCLACGGKMSYVPTDSSNKYYVEAENADDTGADIFEPVDEQESKQDGETSDVANPEADITPEVGDPVPDPTATPEGEQTVSETSDIEDTPEEDKTEDTTEITDYDGNPDAEPKPEGDVGDGAPEEDSEPMGDGAPEVAPELEGESETVTEDTPEGEPVTEETVTDETIETPGEGGTPDEEAPIDEDGVQLPKKDVPKFEKIPKDASEDFLRAIAKYSV